MISGIFNQEYISSTTPSNPLSLHEALESEDPALALTLIRSGADFNKTNDQGLTPVHFAAYKGRTDALILLKEKGADLSVTTVWGANALHSAAEGGHLDTVQYLLSSGLLLSSLTDNGDTVFHYALYGGSVDLLEFFKEYGVDISLATHPIWLCRAATKAQIPLIEWLLENGASVNGVQNERTPLQIAAASENPSIATIDCLLAHGAELHPKDCKGILPFHSAAACGNISVMERFYAYGASVDTCDAFERTPLCMAAEYNQIEATRWLLEHGAQKSVIRAQWVTPYVRALALNYNDCADLIGSDILSETVLAFKKIGHAAALKGTIEISPVSRMEIEGFVSPSIFYHEWVPLLIQKSTPDCIVESFTLAANISLLPSDDIARKIHTKALVILPFQSNRHAYSLIFSNNRMFIADGSGFIGATVAFWEIDSSKVTSKMIDTFKSFKAVSGRDIWWKVSSFLPLLSCFEGGYLEKKIALRKQKVGNCTYASSKIALRIALSCLGIRNYKQVSKEMSISFLKKTLDDWEALKLRHRLEETPSMISLLESARAKLHKKESKLPHKKSCVIS